MEAHDCAAPRILHPDAEMTEHAASTTEALAEGAYIEAGGIRTHYHEGGAGRTVLFVHGSGPGVTAWANWRFTLPIAAQAFHVLAPDLAGFGYTARPSDATYNKDIWVDHLLAFLEAKNVTRFAVVGNSLGGALALALAARRPDLVDALVLMGSAGVPFALTEGLDAVWGYEPSLEAMRELITRYFAFDAAIATPDLVRLRYEASIQPGFQESYAAMFPSPRQRWVEALTTPDDALRRINIPTLILHGRDDVVVPLTNSFHLLEMIANSELHVFGRCGHWVQIERRDSFNALVLDFLSRPN
jgi:pimeloyl-ACP methyl ester carboxylesterase